MLFNDTDHEAFTALAKDNHIQFTTYAELAKKISKYIESLDDAANESEERAETAEEDAQDANDRADDFIDFTRELYRRFGPHAFCEPSDQDLSDLITSARELLARNGVNP